MSFEKNILNFINKSKLKEEQIVVDSIFTTDEGYSKILWAEVDVQIDSTEPQTKELSYSGKAVFDVHYLDNENKIKTFTNTVPFLNKINSEGVNSGSKVLLNANVLDVEIDKQNEKVKAIISLNADVYTLGEMEVLCGCDDSVCLKTDVETTENLLKEDCTTFNEEIAIDITDKMENILSVKSKVAVKDFIPANNYFTLEGEIFTTVKYIQNGEELEKITTENFSETFKREIEVNGLTEEGKVEGFVCIKRDAYKYDINREIKKILIEAPITVCYKAFEEMPIPVASDLFSLTHNLSVITSSYSKSKLMAPEFVESKIEGSALLEENEPRIDKIIGFSNPNLVITNTGVQNGEFVVDGIVSFDISYLNDEQNQVYSVKKEIPFTIRASVEIPDNAQIFPQITLGNVEITARRGREIYLDAKLKSIVEFAIQQEGAVITSAEQGEALAQKNHSIEIFFGQKGDDSWDIAKQLRIKPELISIQNPNLVLPLEQNENIVIYNQKLIN